MTRSRKKNPIHGHTCGGCNRGEKQDKQRANRKLRRKVRENPDTDIDVRDVSDVWDFAKDGKQYWYWDHEKAYRK